MAGGIGVSQTPQPELDRSWRSGRDLPQSLFWRSQKFGPQLFPKLLAENIRKGLVAHPFLHVLGLHWSTRLLVGGDKSSDDPKPVPALYINSPLPGNPKRASVFARRLQFHSFAPPGARLRCRKNADFRLSISITGPSVASRSTSAKWSLKDSRTFAAMLNPARWPAFSTRPMPWSDRDRSAVSTSA